MDRILPKPERRADRAGAQTVRLRVGFVLARHFTLTAFSSFIDMLRLAADEGDRSRQLRCSWKVMSADRQPVRASCGLDVTPDAGFVDPAGFDYVVVVGGLLHEGQRLEPRAEAYLMAAAQASIPLIGVCTGSFILTRLGLLAGRRVCVSWFHRHDFIEAFPAVEVQSDQLFLIDGDRITCSGGAGVIDLAAELVRRHVGEAAARKALNVLLLDRPRAANAVQPAPQLAREARDARVRRAALVMEQNLGHPLPVAEIARRVALGERQLDRLFRAEMGAGPAEIYRRMRIDYGGWLLAQGGRSVAEIAALAGFADGAHFSRAFREQTGQTPTAFRAGHAGDTRRRNGADQPADRRV
jgi:transcriptional regulator GlxA family with amidase domain